ncbi:MAG: 30S ribosomal protein S17 [Kiritimatiellae bacterium]|nr:30S ribosomal protein S17 [Kiritimatiellia bacterium]
MPENTGTVRSTRKRRKGIVVSRSGNKSIVVLVERRVPHPMYGKVLRRTKKFHVHDEKNEAAVGDKVLISECRPMSRLKRWRLVGVLEKAPAVVERQK